MTHHAFSANRGAVPTAPGFQSSTEAEAKTAHKSSTSSTNIGDVVAERPSEATITVAVTSSGNSLDVQPAEQDGVSTATGSRLKRGRGSSSLLGSRFSAYSHTAFDPNDRFAHGRRMGRRIMSTSSFDFVIGLIIIGNCITIGIEQSWDIEGHDTTVLENLEHVYLAVYTLELCGRLFAFHLISLLDRWVQLDLFLVLIGIVSSWILQPILGEADHLGPLKVLRTLRLLRLARAVRLLIKFRDLWMLVRGLLNSANTMIYTLLILFVIIYVFSCMSIELITNHSLAKGPHADPDFKAFVHDNFRNLPLTMLTLLQFATLDSTNLIYMPLVTKDWRLSLFFISIILVLSIVLMNLVTAVVVNSAFEQAMLDKEALKAQEEARRKKLMNDLRKMFYALDDDNSGQVSKEEMLHMGDEDKALLNSILGMSDPLEVFKQLDVDESGSLEIDEFCDGIWQVAISKAPIELKRLEKQVHNLKSVMFETSIRQRSMQETLETALAEIAAGAQGKSLRGACEALRESAFQNHAIVNSPSACVGDKPMSSKRATWESLLEDMAAETKNITSDFNRLEESLNMQLHHISLQMRHLLEEEAPLASPCSHTGIIALGEEPDVVVRRPGRQDAMVQLINTVTTQQLKAADFEDGSTKASHQHSLRQMQHWPLRTDSPVQPAPVLLTSRVSSSRSLGKNPQGLSEQDRDPIVQDEHPCRRQHSSGYL